MASTNITSGFDTRALRELLLTSAAANEGKYLFPKLPFNYRLQDTSLFKGTVRAIPIVHQYGEGGAVTDGSLIRQAHSQYFDATRARSFDETSYECLERSAKVLVDQQEVDDTANTEIAGLRMRESRLLHLTSLVFDAMEYDSCSAIFNTSNFSNATAALLSGGAGVAWNAAGSSPAKDGIAIQNLLRARGAKADYAVCSFDVAQSLRIHPETLNVWYKTSGATNAEPIADMDFALSLWAKRWGLSKGLYCVEAMYNSANPASTASLTEYASGKIAFHCADGLSNTYNVGGNITANGQVSLMCIRTQEPQVLEDVTTDPHGLQFTLKHRFTFHTPYASAATRPAYIITAVNG